MYKNGNVVRSTTPNPIFMPSTKDKHKYSCPKTVSSHPIGTGLKFRDLMWTYKEFQLDTILPKGKEAIQ